jgi:hypothetical protein
MGNVSHSDDPDFDLNIFLIIVSSAAVFLNSAFKKAGSDPTCHKASVIQYNINSVPLPKYNVSNAFTSKLM